MDNDIYDKIADYNDWVRLQHPAGGVAEMNKLKGGKMNNITITNKERLIVVKLYIEDNGNIHEDSWICLNGWGSKEVKNEVN